MPKSHRIVAYDALRAFAIVSVVAIHTLMPYRGHVSATSFVSILDDLLHYAVPLFVFISGAFIWGRDYTGEGHSFGSFFKRRMTVVLVPYLAWSAVYLGVLAVTQPGSLTLQRAIVMILTGETWYHLYFVPMLLALYLLTPIATRLRAFSPELLLVAAYSIRVFAGPEILAFTRSLLGQSGWAFMWHVLQHLPHMALGAWFAVRWPRLPKSIWLGVTLLAAGTAILVAASIGVTRPLDGLAERLVYPVGMGGQILGMALIALRFERRFERFTRAILVASALAFGVYFVHPLFLFSINTAIEARAATALWWHPWFPMAVFTAVTAASFAVSFALARTSGACRLIGLVHPLHHHGHRTR